MLSQPIFYIKHTKRNLLIFLVVISFLPDAAAQQTPLTPVCSRVFTPVIINPAIAGSKDFWAIDLSAVIQGTDKSQLLSSNTRIAKKGPKYFGAPVSKDFTRIGIGASLFNDNVGTSQSIGFITAASYHLPLNNKNLSFISGGIAIKGFENILDSIPETETPQKVSIIPNADVGIYYYGQKFYAGVSAVNLFGNLLDSEELATYKMPVSREYFFISGYKIVLVRSLNVVIEPSIIIHLNDSLNFNERDSYNPVLKLYMEGFCLGAYFHDYSKLTFFFEYKFPRLYLGTLVDFPRSAPFYKKELVVELAAGINFGAIQSISKRNISW
jgi:type IX secretion system PorP/SprF family membrane protein